MSNNIVFWIDSNPFTYVLANSLKNKISGEFFAVIEITDRPKKFFQKQNFVDFKKLWYFHEHVDSNVKHIDFKFLKYIEEKYKIDLWLLAQNERLFNHHNIYHMFTTNEILCILQSECKLFDSILNQNKIDFLITKEPALHHQHLFSEMCKSIGIKVLMISTSKFGYKCLISEEFHKLDNPENLNEIKSTNRNFEDLQNYLKSFNMQKQVIDHKNIFLSSKKEKIKAAFQLLFLSNNSNLKNNFAYRGRTKFRVLYKEILYSLRTKQNKNFLDANSNYKISDSIKFVYFPLHQDPERVLLIGSPFYTNQLETIRHIAKSLPVDYKLLVKEHPSQSLRGWHKPDFYKSITRLPNVELLHYSLPNDEIFKKCSLVISVNGTSSLESAFYGKPSILFSDLSFSVLPSVYVLESISLLPNLIKKALNTKVNPLDVDKYVNLIEKNSFDFDLFKFITEYHDYFYFGGHLADVEIEEDKMKKFLNKQKPIFDELAIHYIKKIQESNKFNNN